MVGSYRVAQSARLLQHVRLFVAGILIALSSSGFSATTIVDKDASYGEMLALAAQMKSLKPSLRTDAAAAKTYGDALARYRDISSAMGGDDPAHIGGGPGALPQVSPLRPHVTAAPPAACGSSTATFTQSTGVAIADNGVTTSTIAVSGLGPYLYDVNVLTNLRHTFSADLDITITSPTGTVVTLTTDNGGTNDDVFNGTLWDDSANPGGQVPYTTNNGLVTDATYANLTTATPLTPEEALGAFIGENPNGTWTITISDDAAGDTGMLDSWSLIFTTFPSAPAIATFPTVTNSTAVAIPTGPAVVTSTINISGAGTSLIDLNLQTFIQHTFSADLDVTLTSPAGTVVTLTTDNGTSYDNVFNGTVWDDSANPGGQVPYTTNNGLVTDHAYVNLTVASPLVPEEPLAAFIGEDPNGTWTLTISDDLAGDGGSLDSWSMDIKTFSCASADLSITKTDGVSTATPGSSVLYTITGSNAGPDPVTDAAINDTFPAALTCTWTCTGAGGGTCTASGSGNINDGAHLPAGASVSYVASCAISASATGSLVNVATIASPTLADPDTGNNEATDVDTLTAQADLAITKTDGVAAATPGGSVTYTITASNAGPSNANGSVVADTFPASETCTWTCGGAGGGTCTAAGSGNINDATNLPAGGSVTYVATCTISAAAAGSLSNTATVTAAAGVTDLTPGNNSATDDDVLSASADLSITKTDGVSSATPGGSVTYTITASNAGPSNASGA
ncbi:MAG TPA: proprotein convertase P-domain-containing protein, partial [Rudaea sp.]